MTRAIIFAATLMAIAAFPAGAACYADYKAKKEGGQLKLHYGVVQISDGACGNRGRAEREVRQKIAKGGWSLLNLMSVFDESGLDQRRGSAANFFLRF